MKILVRISVLALALIITTIALTQTKQKQKEFTFKVKVEYLTQDDYNKWIISTSFWTEGHFMPIFIVEDTERYKGTGYYWQMPYSFNTKEEAIKAAKQFTSHKVYEHFNDSVENRTDFLKAMGKPIEPKKNYYDDSIILIKKELINVNN